MTHNHNIFFCFDEKKFNEIYIIISVFIEILFYKPSKYSIPFYIKKMGGNLSLCENLKLKYYSNLLAVRDVGDFLGLKSFWTCWDCSAFHHFLIIFFFLKKQWYGKNNSIGKKILFICIAK